MHYDLSDYTRQAMVESMKVSKAVFDGLGIPANEQFYVTTDANQPDERNFRAKDGKDYLLNFVGAGHHIGTHRMGVRPTGPELPVDWSARLPMEVDPKVAAYKRKPEIHQAMREFDRCYTDLLRQLHRAFNGRPSALRDAVPIMYQLKYRAQALMAVPTGKANGTTVGPSFELITAPAPPAPRRRRRSPATRRRK